MECFFASQQDNTKPEDFRRVQSALYRTLHPLEVRLLCRLICLIYFFVVSLGHPWLSEHGVCTTHV